MAGFSRNLNCNYNRKSWSVPGSGSGIEPAKWPLSVWPSGGGKLTKLVAALFSAHMQSQHGPGRSTTENCGQNVELPGATNAVTALNVTKIFQSSTSTRKKIGLKWKVNQEIVKVSNRIFLRL